MDLYTELTLAYKRLISFSRLEFNWDSVGANVIDGDAIKNASSFLNYLVTIFTPYQVNPLPSGRVEMRWQGNEYELILEFTRKSRVIYTLFPLKDGLILEQGTAESMDECLQLLLKCLRPELKCVKTKEQNPCHTPTDRRNLPY